MVVVVFFMIFSEGANNFARLVLDTFTHNNCSTTKRFNSHTSPPSDIKFKSAFTLQNRNEVMLGGRNWILQYPHTIDFITTPKFLSYTLTRQLVPYI